MPSQSPNINWLPTPEDHDYPAAASYLSLIFGDEVAANAAAALKAASISSFKAKDVLRASRLTLLGMDNHHVHHDQRKIEYGTALSPLLLVRDPANAQVIIADGYHRLCAVYSFDEDAPIPCKIVSLPA
jgi:hypothetical protein